MRAVCKLLINERNPPEGSFREKKFPRGTLLAPHKQRENPGPKQREAVRTGGPACPAGRAEPRGSGVPGRAGGKPAQAACASCRGACGHSGLHGPVLVRAESGAPSQQRWGSEMKDGSPARPVWQTPTLAHACSGQLKALQTWDHAASQSSPYPGRSQSGLDY